MSQQKGNTCSL